MSFRCADCGYSSGKWSGFCPQCRSGQGLVANAIVTGATVSLAEVAREPTTRLSGLDEVDRVLGGGLLAGAALVLGGEPGVGKSTLMLQMAGAVAGRVAIVSAEETPSQVAGRAQRLGIDPQGMTIVAESGVDAAVEVLSQIQPALVIVDSLQTVSVAGIDGAAGGVSQVRESAARLVRHAKEAGVPLVLISHVTKAGTLAGPKTVEHLVDVVLSLDGDPRLGLRFLRATKNRFGGTHETGVMEMTGAGLIAVPELYTAGAADPLAPGAVTFPGTDGRRVIAMEVQALTTPCAGESPKRSAQGVPRARLDQIIAVLEKHAGVSLARSDVYVKVAGGTRVTDPGVDLAVAAALMSSFFEIPAGRVAVWGEIGLTGGVERVAHPTERRAAARRLGLQVVEAKDTGTRIGQVLRGIGLVPGPVGVAAS